MKKNVSVVSDLCADLLVRGNVTPRYNQEEQLVDDYTVELGGSAAIFASQFAKLGGSVSLYGLVGEDLLGEFLQKALRTSGVRCEVRSSANVKTSLGLGLIRGEDRAMLTYDGSIRALQPDEVFSGKFYQSTDHLHICSYFLLPQFRTSWSDAIGRIRQSGGTVSLDTNWAPDGEWESVRELLPLLDVFLPNEQEALRISGKNSLKEAGVFFSGLVPLTVIKCGGEGALVCTSDRQTAYPVPDDLTRDLHIADTTGAGDNFDAGFLHAWLSGMSLNDCTELAMRCGTGSLRMTGGIKGQYVA